LDVEHDAHYKLNQHERLAAVFGIACNVVFLVPFLEIEQAVASAIR